MQSRSNDPNREDCYPKQTTPHQSNRDPKQHRSSLPRIDEDNEEGSMDDTFDDLLSKLNSLASSDRGNNQFNDGSGSGQPDSNILPSPETSEIF